MVQKVFVRGIQPIGEKPTSDGTATYSYQDIVVCWREVQESGYIQDHALALRLKGESLRQFQEAGVQLGDEVEMNITFECYKSKTTGLYFNAVNGFLLIHNS